MAQLPVEIVCIGGTHVERLDAIVSFLNALQDAFRFDVVRDEAILGLRGSSAHRWTTHEIYSSLTELKARIRGYHPYIIGVVDRCLDGERLGNLFGSMRQAGPNLHGMAVVTLFQSRELLVNIPADVYLLFELLSFSIRFLHGEGLIHRERRRCVFDRKDDKREIAEAIKAGELCGPCERAIAGCMDADQQIAVERVFRQIRDVANALDPSASWDDQLGEIELRRPRVFLCHSSRDKEFVRRLASSLVDRGCRIWFDAWEIRVGDNIVQRISNGLDDSDFLAVVLSKAAGRSAWVTNEWSSKFMAAAEKRNAVVLPVLLEDCDIPTLLRPLKYADFRTPDRYDSGVEELVRAMRGHERTVE